MREGRERSSRHPVRFSVTVAPPKVAPASGAPATSILAGTNWLVEPPRADPRRASTATGDDLNEGAADARKH
jgi:hypothetical protein